mgnify:CR=1 FL=1
MKYEEVIKNIYSLREDILKNGTGLRDFRLKIDILNQINSVFFQSTSIPEVLAIRPNPNFSLVMFESTTLSIIQALKLDYKFLRKEVVGSSTKYLFKRNN